MVLDGLTTKMAAVSLSSVEVEPVDLGNLITAPSALLSLTACVLASRMARLEHLQLALQAA